MTKIDCVILRLLREHSFRDIRMAESILAQLLDLQEFTRDDIHSLVAKLNQLIALLDKDSESQTENELTPANVKTAPKTNGQPKRSHRMTDQEKVLILKQWTKGASYTTIAEAVGRSTQTVTKFLKDEQAAIVAKTAKTD
jgi:DNA-binding NarL/FixJ family response regulator